MHATFKVTNTSGIVLEKRRTPLLVEALVFAWLLERKHPGADVEVRFEQRRGFIERFAAAAYGLRLEIFIAVFVLAFCYIATSHV